MKSREEIRIALGNQIRKIRKARRITQQRFADEAGLSESFYREIELGIANPTLDKLIEISQALHVELSDLFPPTEEEKSTSQE